MRLITHNPGIKFICLALAGLIWIYTAYDQTRVDNFPGSLKLEFRNVSQGLVAISDVENIQIKIVAERKVWTGLSADSFRAYVDLNGLEPGVHELEVQVQNNVAGVQIVEKNPAKVLARLEKTIAKNVPIKVKIEGNAGEGMMAGYTTVTPQEVEASGPQSTINSLLEATAVVGLNNETETVSKMVKLTAFDDQGQEVKNIAFTPAEVKVNVPIVKAAVSKTVGIKVKTAGIPKAGFWVASITTKPSTLSIAGPSSDLGRITYIETTEVSLDGQSSSINRSVALNPPTGITILDNLSRVEVAITIASVESSREVLSSVAQLNLDANLKVASFDPAGIKVLLSGPADGLAKLTATDVVLNLNLSGKSAGTYSLDLKKDMFSVPAGFQILAIMPSSINVVISAK